MTMKPHKREWQGIHTRCRTTPCTVDPYLSEKKRISHERATNKIWLYCNKWWTEQIFRKSYQSLLFQNSILRFWLEGWEEIMKHAQIRLWWGGGSFSPQVIPTLGLYVSSSCGGGAKTWRLKTPGRVPSKGRIASELRPFKGSLLREHVKKTSKAGLRWIAL